MEILNEDQEPDSRIHPVALGGNALIKQAENENISVIQCSFKSRACDVWRVGLRGAVFCRVVSEAICFFAGMLFWQGGSSVSCFV